MTSILQQRLSCTPQISIRYTFVILTGAHASRALPALDLASSVPCMTMAMQESGWQIGPIVTGDNADFTPPGLQQIYNNAHRQSASASSFPPPYARGPSPTPSYASSADDSPLGWWEDGAENILRGHDLQAIQLVCRFRTYRDESPPEGTAKDTRLLESYYHRTYPLVP